MAAIKNVLSPSSDTMMTDNEATKACIKSMLKTLDEVRETDASFDMEPLKTAF